MKIGISGGVGPFRAGISNRGFGIGVGPVHASAGWPRFRRRRRRYRRASGSAAGLGGLLGVLLAIGLLFLLVAWPYLLGTWLAVQLGAGPDSTARTVTGWVFETMAVAGGGLALVLGGRRSEDRGQ